MSVESWRRTYGDPNDRYWKPDGLPEHFVHCAEVGDAIGLCIDCTSEAAWLFIDDPGEQTIKPMNQTVVHSRAMAVELAGSNSECGLTAGRVDREARLDASMGAFESPASVRSSDR